MDKADATRDQRRLILAMGILFISCQIAEPDRRMAHKEGGGEATGGTLERQPCRRSCQSDS